nr:hypothetical protein [Tanacetum cinerariifolium]
MVFNSPMIHVLRVEMDINSPWMLSKNWLVQKQTAFGKDISNPFMADNLPKLVWFSTHLVTFMKSWLVQKQTALGKDTSNPLIVDSLLKTIWFSIHHHLTLEVLVIPRQTATGVNTPRCDEDRLKLTELMVSLLQKDVCVDIGIPAARLSSYCCQVNNQVRDLSTHTTRFISLGLTQKVFANMRRVRKGFSGVETPLSEEMFVAVQPAEEGLVADQVPVDAAVAAAVEAHVAEDVSHDLFHHLHLISFHLLHKNHLHLLNNNKLIENLETDNDAQKLEIVQLKARVKKLEKANKIKSSKLRRLRMVGKSRRVESSDDMEDVFNQERIITDMDMNEVIELVKDAEVAESKGRNAAEHAKKQAEIYNLDLDHSSKVLSIQEDDSKVQEVVEVVTTAKLITEVVTTAALQVSAASATIPAVKPTIPAAAPTVVAAYTRRRKRVIIRDPGEELPLKTSAETPKVKDKGKGILVETSKPIKKKDQIKLDVEYARKLHEEINKDDAQFNKDIDWDAAIDHVKQKSSNIPQYIKRYQGMKKRPQTESEARKNMIIYLKNTAGYKMDFFKGMSYADICLIFQARFDENMRFLFKSREEMEEEDEEIIKSINETPTQKAAKRRKLNEEAQEAEALKKKLEIVNDEDDDVFTEATPLGRKVPVVDYKIVMINNKPRYKIIRADDTHQLYISFITLLKNFDREDLEDLWRIVKERFYTSKPSNFSDDYLLSTLKTMFEKTDGQDAIWRNQSSVYGQALVKS